MQFLAILNAKKIYLLNAWLTNESQLALKQTLWGVTKTVEKNKTVKQKTTTITKLLKKQKVSTLYHAINAKL